MRQLVPPVGEVMQPPGVSALRGGVAGVTRVLHQVNVITSLLLA